MTSVQGAALPAALARDRFFPAELPVTVPRSPRPPVTAALLLPVNAPVHSMDMENAVESHFLFMRAAEVILASIQFAVLP